MLRPGDVRLSNRAVHVWTGPFDGSASVVVAQLRPGTPCIIVGGPRGGSTASVHVLARRCAGWVVLDALEGDP